MAPQPGDYLGYDKNEPIPGVVAGIAGGRGFAQTNPDGSLTRHDRYATGSQWEPANRPVDSVILLQQQLVNAGFAPKSGLVKGVWDQESANAYAGVLGAANRAGVDADTILGRAQDAGDADQGKKKTGAVVTEPNVVTGGHALQVKASQDIAKQAGDTFEKLLGRNISNEETLKIIADLQGRERLVEAQKAGAEDTVRQTEWQQGMDTAHQHEALLAQGGEDTLGQASVAPGVHPIGGHNTVLPNVQGEAAPDPAAYAEWIVKTQMPQEYLGAQMAQRAVNFGQMLKSTEIAPAGPLSKTRV